MVSAMNETNDGGWLFRLITAVGVIGMLLILVGCMVAPVFAPWIRRKLAIEYAEYSDWERRVAKDMPLVHVVLWFIAIAAWAFVFLCNCC